MKIVLNYSHYPLKYPKGFIINDGDTLTETRVSFADYLINSAINMSSSSMVDITDRVLKSSEGLVVYDGEYYYMKGDVVEGIFMNFEPTMLRYKVIDVDTTRLWLVTDYDNIESILYIECINPETNEYRGVK